MPTSSKPGLYKTILKSQLHEQAFLTHLPIKIMTYDIDVGLVVSNIVYIRWLEDLRMAMLDKIVSLHQLLQKGIAPVIAHTEIDYLSPLRYNDNLVASMWVSELTERKCIVSAKFAAGDRVCAVAQQVAVFVDLNQLCSVNIPEAFANKYKEYLKLQNKVAP